MLYAAVVIVAFRVKRNYSCKYLTILFIMHHYEQLFESKGSLFIILEVCPWDANAPIQC